MVHQNRPPTVNNDLLSDLQSLDSRTYYGKVCQYRFTRGSHKGRICGSPCAPNDPFFCKACARNKRMGRLDY